MNNHPAVLGLLQTTIVYCVSKLEVSKRSLNSFPFFFSSVNLLGVFPCNTFQVRPAKLRPNKPFLTIIDPVLFICLSSLIIFHFCDPSQTTFRGPWKDIGGGGGGGGKEGQKGPDGV